MSEQEIINRAYAFGLKYKNSGLSEIELKEKLIHQNISNELAEQVARDVLLESKKASKTNKKQIGLYGIILSIIGITGLFVAWYFAGGLIFFAGGLIIPGIVMTIYGLSE